MNQTITMGRRPAVGASRALPRIDVRKACVRTLEVVRRQSVTLTLLCTAAAYTGVLLGSDPLAYSAAVAALGFVRLTLSDRKGGEK